MRRVLTAAWLLMAAQAALAAPVVLENDWLRAVVSPELGGRVTSLQDKRTGHEFTANLSASAAPAGSGLFLDRFWGARQVRDLETSPYKVRRVTPGQGVELVRGHKAGDNVAFLVEKTIQLPPDRASLIVDYAVSNLAAGDWEGRFWVASLLRPPAGKGEPIHIQFPAGFFRSEYGTRPGTAGRWTFSFLPGKDKGGNYFVGQVSSAWMAVTGPRRSGAVLVADGAYHDDFYACVPSETQDGLSLATSEVLYGPLLLKPSADDASRDELGIPPVVGLKEPGRPWRTRIEVLPSSDLGERIVGAVDGLAIGATVSEKEATLAATSAFSRRLEAAVWLGPLRAAAGAGAAAEVGRVASALRPGEPERTTLALPAAASESHALGIALQPVQHVPCVLSLPTFKAPVDAADYREAPTFVRRNDFEPAIKLPVFDEGAPSPYVAWMKPLRRRPRVMVIIPQAAARDVYEIRQRFDAEIDVGVVAHPHYFVYQGSPEGTDPHRVIPHLLAKPHDLIVIPSGIIWGTFPREVQEGIVRNVEAGTGLVFVSPTVGDYMKMKVAGPAKEVLTEAQEIAGLSAVLTAGVPKRAVPVFNRWPSLEGRIRVRQHGKGRVVVYDLPIGSIWPHSKPYLVRDTVTPFVPQADRAAAEFRFEEYHWLLALRCMAWAAGADLPVLTEVQVSASREAGVGASLALKNTQATEINGEVHVRWLNRRGEDIGSAVRKATLRPGANRVELRPDRQRAGLLPGVVLAEVIARDADGCAVGCAAGETVFSAEPRINAISLAKFGHEPGEKVAGSLDMVGAPTAGARLSLSVFDMAGRLIVREGQPLTVGEEVRPPVGLVPNGDFEAGASGPASRGRIPQGWLRPTHGTPQAVEIAPEPRPGSPGRHCLKVATDDRMKSAGLYSPLVPLDGSKPLYVTGWVRADGGEGVGAYLGVGWYNARREPIEMRKGTGLNYTYVLSAFKGEEWTQAKATFRPAPAKDNYGNEDIPPGTAFFDVRVFNLEYPRPSRFDDLLATQDPAGVPITVGRPVAFSCAPGRGLTALHRLDVSLLAKDGGLLDSASAEFAVRPPTPDDVVFQTWGPRYTPGTAAGDMEARLMREAGFDWAAIDAGVTPPDDVRANALALMRLGLRVMPMSLMRIEADRESFDGPVRKPCLTDPQFRAGLRERMKDCIPRIADLYPAAYFNGDENSLGSYSRPHDFCQSPTCLERFRGHLKDKYGAVERLNAEWRTAFRDWAEVKPLTLAEARATSQWAPWVEHRAWMPEVLADTLGFQRAIVREFDAAGRFAVSGMGGPTIYNGFDWPILMPHLDHMAGYARQHMGVFRSEFFRAFRRPGNAFMGTWTGYGADDAFIADSLWWEVLSGFFCPAYYCSDDLHTPGMSATATARLVRSTVDELRSGIGKLLLVGERLEDPIAVHHSFAAFVSLLPASERSAILKPDNYYGALDGWVQMLHELGCQFRFVDRRQVKAGGIAGGRFRVFIMPLAHALDEKEVAEARRFVEEGGLLVADPVFGRCRESGAPALDPTLAAWAGLPPPGDELQWPVDPPARVTPRGKGKVAVLGLKLWDYPTQRSQGRGRDARDAVRRLLAEAGVRPAQECDSGEQAGPVLWGGEVVRFGLGAGEVVAIRRNAALKGMPGRSVAARWDRPAHLYDVRGRKYLGLTAEWRGDLDLGGLAILARWPFRIEPPKAAVQTPRTPPGKDAVVDVELAPPSASTTKHVLHIEVFQPDGLRAAAYCRNVEAESGRCRIAIPHALNDAAGAWKAVVREVVSGLEATVAWEVAP